MSTRGQGGYILASAMGILFAISIVAAALVGSSGDTYLRLRQAEADARQQAALDAALVVVGAQLALDPRRRAIGLDDGDTFEVMDQKVAVRLAWETNKLDINRAEPEAVDQALTDHGFDQATRDDILSRIKAARAGGKPVRLLTDLGADKDREACLSSFLTVFGGVDAYGTKISPDAARVGRPAAGAKVAIDLQLVDEKAGISAVVLATGDPRAPFKVLDWRRGRVGEACNG